MINNRIYICIFAVLPRGSGLRRGTTCKRLGVDKGRLLIACRFDPVERRRELRRSTIFFGFLQAYFWVIPGVCPCFRSLKVTKSFIHLNADSIKFVTFAASLINKQVIMCQLQVQVYANETAFASNKRLFERIVQVNDSCSIPYETIAKAVAFLYGLDVVLIYKLTLK